MSVLSASCQYIHVLKALEAITLLGEGLSCEPALPLSSTFVVTLGSAKPDATKSAWRHKKMSRDDKNIASGRHFAKPGVPRRIYRSEVPAAGARPDETSVFLAAALDSRRVETSETDQTKLDGSPSVASIRSSDYHDTPVVLESDAEVERRAEKSSNLVSALVIVSRITGFFRTSIQAWAIGATMLGSCYTLAAQMPNVMYELVIGGMLVTSFLPVYVKMRERAGREGATAYASNLLSFVLLIMFGLTALSFVFAKPIIWTQSAGAAETFDFDLTVWFFRWFSCEIILYALSSIFSGVLNAERDYLWSNGAPILNNVITIASFLLYGFVTKSGMMDPSRAVIILAVGNPLAVAVQVLCQVPALRRHGVRIRPRIDFHDPALKDTLSIGLPTLIVTFVAYPTTAVMSSCMLQVTDAGAAISYYARVWYVLPFSIFAIPISVTMFTELSSYCVKGEMSAFVSGFSRGVAKILFTLIPFSMYFVIFARPLTSIIASGAFTPEAADVTAAYLAVLGLTLPFYGLSTYLQKACSALLSMKFYAAATCVAAVVQIAVCLVFTPRFGLLVVPFSSVLYYLAIDAVTMLRLRSQLGPLGMRSVVVSVMRSIVLGALGSLVGWSILGGLQFALGPCDTVLKGLLCATVGGLPALLATFGLATMLGISDSPFFDALFSRIIPVGLRRADSR